MLNNRRTPLVAFTLCLLSLGFCVAVEAQSGRLKFKSSVKRDSLKTVVSVSISPDGRFAYTTSYGVATITAFSLDPKTGSLEHLQTVEDRESLLGVTAMRLSRDGTLGVATSFSSRTVSLFSRDLNTGLLKLLDVVKEGERGAIDLNHVIDAAFSPDAKFVYAIADRSESLVTLQVVGGKRLKFVNSDMGRDACFQGARGIAISPDGKSIYIASNRAGTLAVLSRDVKTGTATLKQVLKDSQGEIDGLDGVFGITCSSDGRYVYTSAGRFRGDDAVCVFKRADDGTLSFVQSLSGLQGFLGGNEIVVSPDGHDVYACGSKSNTMMAFNHDAKTGKLSAVQTLSDGNDGDLGGVSGLAISPDGRFVYAAAETDAAISIYERAVSDRSN